MVLAPNPPMVEDKHLRDEVWNCLATVNDPELDESVTDMGFIDRLEIDKNNEVIIEFRLPTFWCAPNFAFLMANDMREAVEKLSWVPRVIITLTDHCHAEAINNGVHKGLSFSEAFPEQTEANLDELREIFRRKAFKMRQELLLRTLKEIGYKGSELCLLKIDELVAIVSEDHNFSLLRSRYLEVRKEFGGPYGCDKLAFTSDTGEAISSESFVEYLSGLRRVRVNSEFNANMCRSVLKSRYGENKKVATN